jgi:tetratricopeptide (TPR) repeat protein
VDTVDDHDSGQRCFLDGSKAMSPPIARVRVRAYALNFILRQIAPCLVFSPLMLAAASSTGPQPPGQETQRAKNQDLLVAANQKMRKGDYRGAEVLLERVLTVDPGQPQAMRMLRSSRFHVLYEQGSDYMAQQAWKQARRVFAAALKYGTSRELEEKMRAATQESLLQEGGALLGKGSFEAAASQYQLAFEINPTDRRAWNGLREARYDACYQKASEAVAQNSPQEARERLSECLVFKPNDSQVSREIQMLDQSLSLTGRAQDCMARAGSFIDRRDWQASDREIRALAEMIKRESLTGPPLRQLTLREPLLPAFLSYARGDVSGALEIATRAGSPTYPHTLNFCDFLRDRRRRSVVRACVFPLGVTYSAVLVLSVYLGLQRSLRLEQRKIPLDADGSAHTPDS